MTIGANTNKYAPSKAFFSDAKFSNSTLTTPSWTYVAMNDSTSTDQNPYDDTHLPPPAGFRYGGKTIK